MACRSALRFAGFPLCGWALAWGLAFGLAPSAQGVQLSTSEEVPVGDVSSHIQSPDGLWVVYGADQDTDGVRELYSVPADGSAAPVKLNGSLTFGTVGAPPDLCKITPDSQRVLYRAQDAGTGMFGLYSVPIAGGASLNLSGANHVDSGGNIEAFQISPDGTRVVYASGSRLYGVAIGGGTSVQLSQPLQIPTGHGTYMFGTYAIAPDSTRVVFASDETGQSVLRLHSRALTGGPLAQLSTSFHATSPTFAFHPDGERVVFAARDRIQSARIDGSGKPIQLTPQHDRFVSFELDPLGERVVYIGYDDGGSRQLYSAHIPPPRVRLTTPPSETQITPAVAWSRTLFQFEITADSERVVYHTDQSAEGHMELFSAPLGDGAPTRLDPAPTGVGSVITFRLAADGATVFYMADILGTGPYHLFRVPLEGGTSTQLSPTLVAGGTLWEFELCAPAGRVVYRAEQDTDGVVELYSVPEGGGASLRLNPPLSAGLNVQEFQLTASGRVVYLADQDENEAVELFSVPATGGGVAQLNGTLPLAEVDDVTSFAVDELGANALYLADENVDAWPELYTAPIDGSAPSDRFGPPPSFLGRVSSYQLMPDGASLLVLATVTPGIAEVFTLPLDGSAPPLRIATPPPGQGISSVALSPDAARIAYFIGSGSARELHSAPTDGSLASTRLDDGVATPQSFRIVAGPRVVYLSTNSGYRLWSIPIDGGTRVQLSPTMPSNRFISDVGYTTDLTRVAFRADVDIAGVSELYSAPVDGSTPAVKLNPSLPAGRDVFEFALTLDGTRALYTATQESPTGRQLYSVPLDGSAAPVKLSGSFDLNSEDAFLVSPTSDRVVFHRRQGTIDGFALYSAPVDGSAAAVQISAPFVSGGWLSASSEWAPYGISPDGLRVAYVASQDVAGMYELYCVPIDGSAAPVKLSPPLAANRDVLGSQRNFANGAAPGLHFRADSQRVVFRTGGGAGLGVELFEAPVDASEPANRLHPALVPNGEVTYAEVRGERAFYLADRDADEVFELYSSELGD